jgi:hypothetical protein
MLIERLAQSDAAAPGLDGLHADLAAASDDEALARVVARVAELAAEHGAGIARERAEVAATLAQVAERLEEMAIFLASANSDRERHHEDTESLNVELLVQATRLSDEVRGSDDLVALRALVAGPLEAVAANVRDFGERAQLRFVAHVARAQRMRSRDTELEGETRAALQPGPRATSLARRAADPRREAQVLRRAFRRGLRALEALPPSGVGARLGRRSLQGDQ